MENCINDYSFGITDEMKVAGTAVLLATALLASEMSGTLKMEYEEPEVMNTRICESGDTFSLHEASLKIEEWKAENVGIVEIAESAADFSISDAGEAEYVIIPDKELPGDIGSDVIIPGEDVAGDIGSDVIIPGEDVSGDTGSDVIIPGEDVAGDMDSDMTVPGEDSAAEEQLPAEETEQVPASLNGFLIDGEGMIYGVDAAILAVSDGYLELPSEGCVGIRSGALAETGAGIVEVYIPANISVIEEGAFSGLYRLEWMEAAAGNPGCMSMDGALLDGSGTTLLAFPGGRTDMYVVPAGVTRIAPGAFSDTGISYIDFWQCGMVEIGENIFGGSDGNGIEIRVPAENIQWYQEVFAGYNVQIL